MSNAKKATIGKSAARPTRHQIAAEALCSALWNLDFKAIGETEGGRVSWFTRGVHPKNVRVRVERSALVDEAKLVIEWRNFANGTRLKGEQMWTLDCGPNADMNKIPEAVQEIILGVLDVFRQVLAEEGVAGPIAKLVDTPPEGE